MGVEDREGQRWRKWGPVGVVAFWLVIMGGVYAGMTYYLKPAAVVVSASGAVKIPRARDGHFYVEGAVNGRPITFLVDTGASSVFVSEAFAQAAGSQGGEPTTFTTANGTLAGRTVRGVSIAAGPLSVSGLRVGVGLSGGAADHGLLGQNFLSKFKLSITEKEMVLQR